VWTDVVPDAANDAASEAAPLDAHALSEGAIAVAAAPVEADEAPRVSEVESIPVAEVSVSGAAETEAEPAAEAPRSLDVELSAFELRDEERVVPPAPIPGLPLDASSFAEPEGSVSCAATPAVPDCDEDDAFSAELAVVTAEVHALHAQDACAEVLEKVAARLRAGQIPAAVTDARNEAAVLAAVLASLLAQRA
jgi:hypothetical protein